MYVWVYVCWLVGCMCFLRVCICACLLYVFMPVCIAVCLHVSRSEWGIDRASASVSEWLNVWGSQPSVFARAICWLPRPMEMMRVDNLLVLNVLSNSTVCGSCFYIATNSRDWNIEITMSEFIGGDGNCVWSKKCAVWCMWGPHQYNNGHQYMQRIAYMGQKPLISPSSSNNVLPCML